MEKINELTIGYAKKNKGILLDLLSSNKKILLDFSSIQKIDMSGFQLLFAFYKSCEQKKLECVFVGELCEDVKKVIRLIGLDCKDCNTGESLLNALKAV